MIEIAGQVKEIPAQLTEFDGRRRLPLEQQRRFRYMPLRFTTGGRPQGAVQRPRRGGRVVECTALEMRHTGNRIGGSNPSLSAIISYMSVI